MSHFSSYSTGDEGSAALGANASIPPMQITGGVDAVVAGYVISDQAGVLVISQTFDGTNWDISQSFTYSALGIGLTFNVDIIAPSFQISYTNGGEAQSYMRLFARSFGNRSSG